MFASMSTVIALINYFYKKIFVILMLLTF